MSTVRTSSASVKTRAVARPHISAVPQSQPQTKTKATRRATDIRLYLVMLIALPICALGLLYFGCYVWLNKECYSRVELLTQIRSEKERAIQLEQALAQMSSTARIEQKAAQLGMTPADLRQAISLGTP